MDFNSSRASFSKTKFLMVHTVIVGMRVNIYFALSN